MHRRLQTRTEGPLEKEPVLCGRVRWAEGVGTFRYAPDWLASAAGYDLDPINLRRLQGDMHVRVNNGVPGVLADARPDAWGLLEPGTRLSKLRLSRSGSPTVPGLERCCSLNPALGQRPPDRWSPRQAFPNWSSGLGTV